MARSKLPILISVPHAGLEIPREVQHLCLLTPEEVMEDSDAGAPEIFGLLKTEVEAYLTSGIARVIVDLNRAEKNRKANGVIKKHTFQKKPVWGSYPPEELIQKLLDQYYRPYHQKLQMLSKSLWLGVDCHTMAFIAPPVSPDPGQRRPRICLGNASRSCSTKLLTAMKECLEESFQTPISINYPFPGGYITRSRPGGIPWMQVEVSREEWMSEREKGIAIQKALLELTKKMVSPR